MPEANPNTNPNNTNAINDANTNTTVNNPDTPNTTANPANTTNSPAPTPAEPTQAAPQTSTAAPTTPTPEAPQPPTTDTPISVPSPILKSIVKKPTNKLLPVVIILAILTVAGLGTSIFAFAQSSDKDTEIIRLKNSLANQNYPITDDPDSDETDGDYINTGTNFTITPEIRAQVLASVPTRLTFTNPDSEVLHIINTGIEGFLESPIHLEWRLEDNRGTLTLNWDYAKQIYGLNTPKSGNEAIYNFGPSSGTVIDVLAAGFGQAAGDETLFFLMSDGTIEYIPLATAFADSNFNSFGKINNVSNVIKLFFVYESPREGAGGGVNVLAQRADGELYDLYQIMHGDTSTH